VPFVLWGLDAIALTGPNERAQELRLLSAEITCSCLEPSLLSFGEQKGIISA